MPERCGDEAYENGETPDPCWLPMGNFESAQAAVACALQLIDKSLASMHREGQAAESWRMGYLGYGEVPSSFNAEGLQIDPNAYVHRPIREPTGEIDWQPKNSLPCQDGEERIAPRRAGDRSPQARRTGGAAPAASDRHCLRGGPGVMLRPSAPGRRGYKMEIATWTRASMFLWQ